MAQANDNRPPMSPLGTALFDMMADMALAQADLYGTGADLQQVEGKVKSIAQDHETKIITSMNAGRP